MNLWYLHHWVFISLLSSAGESLKKQHSKTYRTYIDLKNLILMNAWLRKIWGWRYYLLTEWRLGEYSWKQPAGPKVKLFFLSFSCYDKFIVLKLYMSSFYNIDITWLNIIDLCHFINDTLWKTLKNVSWNSITLDIDKKIRKLYSLC